MQRQAQATTTKKSRGLLVFSEGRGLPQPTADRTVLEPDDECAHSSLFFEAKSEKVITSNAT
jgi:hypothetical protein